MIVGLLTAAVVVLAVLVVGLLRSHAVMVRALHDAGFNLDPDRDVSHPHPGRAVSVGDPVRSEGVLDLRTVPGVASEAGVSGTKAHDLSGTLPNGGARNLAVRSGQSTLLAFLSTGCGTCGNFWDAFGRGVQLPAATRLVVVTKGDREESPSAVAALAPEGVVTIMSSEAWDDYGVPVAPYFALVDGSSGVVVGEGAAHSWELVEAMLGRAVADGVGPGTRGGDRPDPISRREMLLGRARQRDIDDELIAAGLEPGDPRLRHRSPFAQADETTLAPAQAEPTGEGSGIDWQTEGSDRVDEADL